MKKHFRVSLIWVAASMAACGGATGDEIQAGLRDASRAREKSTLGFAVGEKWTGTRTEMVARMPYKYEGAKAIPCDPSLVEFSAANCGTPLGIREIRTTDLRSEVLGQGDTASLKAPGFVVQENRREVIDSQTYFPVDGTSGTANPKLTVDSSAIYTLAEYNGFVVRLDENQANDSSKGAALYPAHPVRGATYTDDTGMVWTVTGTSKVAVGDKTLSAADVTATTSRMDLMTLADLKDKCFLRTAAGAGNTQLILKNECRRPFTMAYSVFASVSLDLALIITAHRETIEIPDRYFGVRDAFTGSVSDFFPTDRAGELVFVFNKTIEDSTYTMSSLAMK